MSDELALRLLALAAEQPFGAFAHLAARDEVWLQHAILGDDLDRVELETAIDAVAATPTGATTRSRGEFGGLRYADLG